MVSKKNLGLDLIRIFAAFLVIICHSGYFSVGISYAVVDYTGILAVDFFFVLSGLLVGKSLILAVTDPDPAKKLKGFYINRIFRTLPLYYIMLFVTSWLKGESIPLSCFLFLHNFSEADLGFMPVAWSLSIEMWFYFVIPPVFLLLYRAFKKKFTSEKAVFCAIGVLYAVPLALRILYVLLLDPVWDNGVRKQILLRLDAVMLGVFFAALKLYKKDTYRKISTSNITLLVSVGGILLSWLLHKYYYVLDGHYNGSVLSRIFAFTLLPALCMLLVLYLENSRFIENLKRFRISRLVFWLSSLTYGIYLLQLPVFEQICPYFWDKGFAENCLGFMGAVLVTVILAQITYWLVEVPSEKIRDKILSKD